MEFIGTPPLQKYILHPYKLGPTEIMAVDTEIQNLLDKEVIVRCDHIPGQFISNIFTREKEDGRLRVMLNLSELKNHLSFHYFKMDTFETVVQLLIIIIIIVHL